ncbi:MAG TPA: hypothetical protein VI981_05650 [Candidatus Paceibacterota bacterium]
MSVPALPTGSAFEVSRTHVFCNPERKWVQPLRGVFLDHRIPDSIDLSSVMETVHEVKLGIRGGVRRIEVFPYQWVWDDNFVSVAICCQISINPPCQLFLLFSIRDRKLATFGGLEEY